MSDDIAASHAVVSLIEASRVSRSGAMAGALSFLGEYGAGYPDVPMLEEKVRDDARFWASLAGPHELEAYTVAAITELQNAPLLDKQLRRLAAASFRRMKPETRLEFLEWVARQEGE